MSKCDWCGGYFDSGGYTLGKDNYCSRRCLVAAKERNAQQDRDAAEQAEAQRQAMAQPFFCAVCRGKAGDSANGWYPGRLCEKSEF